MMRLLVLALALTWPALGKRIELEFPGLTHRVQVSFPENHEPSRTWPAVFYYHGTNGIPDTAFIEHHTDKRDWIVVGMSYLQRGEFTITPETLADEMQILHSVRHHLATRYKLDPRRVYLAGFSKGGWMAGMLIQRDPSLAGAAIMGAGHLHETHAGAGPFRKRTPIFLGVGRRDGNYPFTLRAVTHFRSLKAPVTMETWHDLEHTFPREGSPGLRQWLALEGNRTHDHTAEATAWVGTRLEEIEEIADPVARWLAVRDVEAAPYFDVVDEKQRDSVRSLRHELEKLPEVTAEARALAAHRKLLRQEIATQDQANYEKLLVAYLELSQRAAGTRQGKLAYHDHLRVERLLKHHAEQKNRQDQEANLLPPEEKNPLNPTMPSDGRNIPKNPLVR